MDKSYKSKNFHLDKRRIFALCLFWIVFLYSWQTSTRSLPRNAYLVQNLPFHNKQDDIASYAGFIPVRKLDSNNSAEMFFWYFPAQEARVKNAPLVIWLQGGPGSSSMIGLFHELGPLQFVDEQLHLRKETWNKHFNLLFIDNPVGTGYSFVNKTKQKEFLILI